MMGFQHDELYVSFFFGVVFLLISFIWKRKNIILPIKNGIIYKNGFIECLIEGGNIHECYIKKGLFGSRLILIGEFLVKNRFFGESRRSAIEINENSQFSVDQIKELLNFEPKKK